MNKSIFKANFEDSLNLYDDSLLSLNNSQHLKIEDQKKNGQVSILFRIKSLLLTIMFPIGLNFLLMTIPLFITFL